MAFREFHFFLLNSATKTLAGATDPTGVTLTLTTVPEDNQGFLCHGFWDGGGIFPPTSIGPGTEGEWKSASGGSGTGTQGWLTYSINDSNGKSLGFVCISWHNPFALGSTSFGRKVSRTPIDVQSCEIQGEPDGSNTFSVPSGFELRPAWSGKESNDWGDFGVAGPVPPLILFWSLGITASPVVHLELVNSSGSMRKQAMKRGYDVKAGVRMIRPNDHPVISLRSVMGLPPF